MIAEKNLVLTRNRMRVVAEDHPDADTTTRIALAGEVIPPATVKLYGLGTIAPEEEPEPQKEAAPEEIQEEPPAEADPQSEEEATPEDHSAEDDEGGGEPAAPEDAEA